MILEITLFALVIISTYLCCYDIDNINFQQNATRPGKRKHE
jgi:hypothetical protein